jgi:hypothetical protein
MQPTAVQTGRRRAREQAGPASSPAPTALLIGNCPSWLALLVRENAAACWNGRAGYQFLKTGAGDGGEGAAPCARDRGSACRHTQGYG